MDNIQNAIDEYNAQFRTRVQDELSKLDPSKITTPVIRKVSEGLINFNSGKINSTGPKKFTYQLQLDSAIVNIAGIVAKQAVDIHLKKYREGFSTEFKKNENIATVEWSQLTPKSTAMTATITLKNAPQPEKTKSEQPPQVPDPPALPDSSSQPQPTIETELSRLFDEFILRIKTYVREKSAGVRDPEGLAKKAYNNWSASSTDQFIESPDKGSVDFSFKERPAEATGSSNTYNSVFSRIKTEATRILNELVRNNWSVAITQDTKFTNFISFELTRNIAGTVQPSSTQPPANPPSTQSPDPTLSFPTTPVSPAISSQPPLSFPTTPQPIQPTSPTPLTITPTIPTPPTLLTTALPPKSQVPTPILTPILLPTQTQPLVPAQPPPIPPALQLIPTAYTTTNLTTSQVNNIIDSLKTTQTFNLDEAGFRQLVSTYPSLQKTVLEISQRKFINAKSIDDIRIALASLTDLSTPYQYTLVPGETVLRIKKPKPVPRQFQITGKNWVRKPVGL